VKILDQTVPLRESIAQTFRCHQGWRQRATDQVVTHGFADLPVLQLLMEVIGCEVEHPVELFLLAAGSFSRLRIMPFRPGQIDMVLIGKVLNGVDKREVVMPHDKADNIPSGATTKAMKQLAGGIHMK